MTNLISYTFESNHIRIVEIDGSLWFVAKDVAATLGYVDTAQAVRKHCRRAKSLKDIGASFQRPGEYLDLQIKLIPESDVYRLTMRSKLESAENFQDWVEEDVLPKIRKTGSYSLSNNLPQETAVRVLKAEMEAYTIFKVPEHVALIETTKLIARDYGVDYSYMLEKSPVLDSIKETEEMLEPTELAQRFDFKNARMLNLYLEDKGFQYKVGEEWFPTERSKSYAKRHAWKVGTKSGYNLKWNVKFVESIIEEDSENEDSTSF